MSAHESVLDVVSPREMPLTTDGGHRISLRIFSAEPSRSVVIIAGAMGVSQNCYEKFARFLCTEGHTVLTFDYFGTGASLQTHLRDCPTSVTDWGNEDCHAVIEFARRQYPGQRLQWVGHSVGGQLLGMTPNVNRLDNAITVAVGSGYWRENSPPTKRIAWILWYFVAPASLRLVGYYPGSRLRLVGDLPPNVMRQWRRWCLHRDYAVGVEGESLREQFANVRVPITAVSFTDDEMMSERNTESIHSFYCNAPVTMQRIAPADVGERQIGHLGWFRERYRESLWQGVLLPLLK